MDWDWSDRMKKSEENGEYLLVSVEGKEEYQNTLMMLLLFSVVFEI